MARQSFRHGHEARVEGATSEQRDTGPDTGQDGPQAAAPSYEELQAQLEALRDDVMRLSDSLMRLGEDRARDAMHSAAEQAGKRADLAAEHLDSLLEDAAHFARKRPGLAMGIAASAGFLLAMMMSRR